MQKAASPDIQERQFSTEFKYYDDDAHHGNGIDFNIEDGNTDENFCEHCKIAMKIMKLEMVTLESGDVKISL